MSDDGHPGIRRLAFDDLDPSLQAALAARVERLGYLGDFFAYAAHQPAALLAFNEFTEQLKEAMPPDLCEAVALTVASRIGNRYEQYQHERLSVALGLGRGFVEALIGPEVAPAGLDDRVRSARLLATAILADNGHGCAAEVARCVEVLGEAGTVGVLLLVSRYLAHGAFSNALGIQPPVRSIFDEGLEGEQPAVGG